MVCGAYKTYFFIIFTESDDISQIKKIPLISSSTFVVHVAAYMVVYQKCLDIFPPLGVMQVMLSTLQRKCKSKWAFLLNWDK